MTLEEILQNEKINDSCIYLYQEEGGGWYAYERSAFYCYSLLGILDIDWLALSASVDQQVIRVRVSEPDKFLHTSLLKLLKRRKTEYVILCRISCGGFFYWREEQKMKCRRLWEHQSNQKLV